VRSPSKFSFVLFTLFLALILEGICRAEPRLTCAIERVDRVSRSIGIDCEIEGLAPGRAALRFRDRFAGIDRLSERIYGIRLTAGGNRIPLEIRGSGLYLMPVEDRGAPLRLSWEMRLARPLDPSQYALTSSLGAQAAILHPADLLPRICSAASEDCLEVPLRLEVKPPDGWKTIVAGRSGEQEIDDLSKAVVLMGDFREREFSVGSMRLRAAVAGLWSFTDEEIFGLAESIAVEQSAMIESREKGDYLVTLAPFPLPLTGLRSSGICAGGNAVLLLNEGNAPQQSLGLLSRHLAHEMFHYYLPNAFRVRENFDWFWEGFTRYAALLTLTRRGLLDLGGYLDSIGEEYESYFHNPLSAHRSLIAASSEKFSNQAMTDLVYRKGTLVAALFDLEVRRQSRGSSSIIDALKSLYRNHAITGKPIGNREVLDELSRPGEFSDLIRNDIEGVREIDLAERVKPYGLFLEWSRATGGRARITVAPKASAEKRRILSGITGKVESKK